MLREKQIDLWKMHDAGEWICITTNPDINAQGRLVMGRGCAEQAANKFNGLANHLACLVKEGGNHVYEVTGHHLLTFPVKHHWKDRADTKLIQRSAQELADWAGAHNWPRVYIPRPGCGNGGLRWSVVKPLLEDVWKVHPHRFVIVHKDA